MNLLSIFGVLTSTSMVEIFTPLAFAHAMSDCSDASRNEIPFAMIISRTMASRLSWIRTWCMTQPVGSVFPAWLDSFLPLRDFVFGVVVSWLMVVCGGLFMVVCENDATTVSFWVVSFWLFV